MEIVRDSEKAITKTTVGTLEGGNIKDVPASTKVSALKAGLTVSDKATVEIVTGAGGDAVADQEHTDVTAAMKIKVTAEDKSTQEYDIAMQGAVAKQSSEKAITKTTVGTLQDGNIKDVPASTKVSALKAGLTVSDKAKIGRAHV